MSNQTLSFQQTYDKTIKFYDFQYHLHKSTFKGLSGLIKQYSQIEKYYADKLFNLSKNSKIPQLQLVYQYIPDLTQQLPPIANTLSDFNHCISNFSQLHHNYSQRLLQVSTSLLSEYNSSKRLKQKHMKLLKDLSQEKLQKAKQSRNKQQIIVNQMQTCRKLFQHLDTYADQQMTRVQKVKQQLLIFLSLTKKIQQKHLETTTKFKTKITQQEIQLKSTQLDKVSEMIVGCYNNNATSPQFQSQNVFQREKLVSKKYQMIKKVQVLRQSLKQSTLFRQKVGRMDNFKYRLTITLRDYERLPQSLPQYNLIIKQNNIKGLFNHNILKHVRKYSNLIKTSIIKKLSYTILVSYYQSYSNNNNNKSKSISLSLSISQIKTLLLTIKANLKLRGQIKSDNCKSIGEFLQRQMKVINDNFRQDTMIVKNNQSKQMQFHVGLIVLLSEIYCSYDQQQQLSITNKQQNTQKQQQTTTQTQLLQFINSQNTYKNTKPLSLITPKSINYLHPTILHVIIKTLLQSIITIDSNNINESDEQPMLVDNFVQIVQIIQNMSQQWLGIQKKLVRLIAVQVIQSVMKCVKGKFVEQVHLLVQGISTMSSNSKNKYQDKNDNNSNSNKKSSSLSLSSQTPSPQSIQKLQSLIISTILTSLTPAITTFYTLPIPLINYFCILICIQKLSTQKPFSAVEYFHKCIKRAGYSYIFWIDEQKKIIQPMIWQGEMRLKNMVDILQQMQYKKLQQTHFIPTAEVMSPILGVDKRIILQKLKQQLLLPLGDIIQQNLSLLQNQHGIDKQGYILKLGVLIAQMDIAGYRSQQFINKYFIVLQMYLNNTQIQYNNLLQHSRKTELWIIEQNTLATQNCVDFCSLLYKPFEFLLKTIKSIALENKTQFTRQFSQFIKKKLNTILKQQIVKYINFLYDSLKQYNNTNNKTISQQSLHYKTNTTTKLLQLTQQHSHHTKITFIQSIKRLYNLNFLKSQLNEIINDFLDDHILQQLQHNIFCLDKLSITVTKYKQHKQILCNLKDIVESTNVIQEKIIQRISAITVHNCMSKLFNNLYYQQEKSAFQQFFSTKQDYTFSKFTFVHYQKNFEDLFNMIHKHLPQQIQQKYYPKMMTSFYIAIKFQLLNTAKFKLPKSKQEIVRYVDEDCSFICTMLKQRFIQSQIVQLYLQKPLKTILNMIKSSTKDLIQKFQTQTLNNNKQQCKAILIMLYMRVNDEKAQEFFKKFKNVVFK